jgi:hypothetical protein
MSAYTSSGNDPSDSGSESYGDNEDASEMARQRSPRGPGVMKFFDQESQIIWLSRMAVAAIMLIAFVGVVTAVFIATRDYEAEYFENQVSE